MKVTVLGASGGIGQPLSLLLGMHLPAHTELALYDVSPLTPGVAKDLSHVPTPVIVRGYGKDELHAALARADIVLIPAGVPRKPGMTRGDLVNVNAGIAAGLTRAVAHVCPKAMLGIITNPVNSLVPMAARILREAGVYDPNRLFGVTTLDTLRANTFVAELKHLPMGVPYGDVEIRVIGGHSGDTILPLYSQSGIALTESEIVTLTARVRNAGTEVVEAKAGAGSATLSMAVAGWRFGWALARALQGETGIVECAYVEDGEYAPFFARPVRLGVSGVVERLPIGPLSAYEEQSLAACLPILAQEIELGLGLGEHPAS